MQNKEFHDLHTLLNIARVIKSRSNSTETEIKEIWCESVDWIHLA